MSLIRLVCAIALSCLVTAAHADARGDAATNVLNMRYKLALELIRHTPTYTPPVASRALAYLGVASYEAIASGSDHMASLAGQLNDLTPTPPRDSALDDAVVLEATLAALTHDLFANTGPSGQHAMEAMDARLGTTAAAGLPADVTARSVTYGATLAAHIDSWARADGGAVIDNMGFSRSYTLNTAPGHWSPANKIVQQQAPLLPDWGKNRRFAMPASATCALPPPPAYSEDKSSDFYKLADEVYQTSRNLTDDQRATARFWADDAMLTYTPAGHWTAILNEIATTQAMPLDQHVNALARLGSAMADAFIGCWAAKYHYDTIRPIAYIKKVIDPNWEPLLTTPPFPEYPSGHSDQSAAAASVLTQLFGANFAFDDETPTPDGSPMRHFASFNAAADEAAMSRLYGGIHFRPAIEQGQTQGRCIAAYTNALVTLK